MVSRPAKRKFASIPVRASGDRLVRSSRAMRISSFQSSASGVKVTRPMLRTSSAVSILPLASRAFATGATSSAKRVAKRLRPLFMVSGPKFIKDSARCGASSSLESSMKLRSAARTISSSVPAKQESGSTRAKIEREETSMRRSTRRRKLVVSRTSQCSRWVSSNSSWVSTASIEPCDLNTQVPISSSLVRSIRIASSSSRANFSAAHWSPRAMMPTMSVGCSPSGPARSKVATRAARSILIWSVS